MIVLCIDTIIILLFLVTKMIMKGSKGTEYTVEYDTCTCPDFLYRRRLKGEICKHIKLFRETYVTNNPKYSNVDEIAQTINNGDEAYKFVEMYGEDMLNHIKKLGFVYEKTGKLWRM